MTPGQNLFNSVPPQYYATRLTQNQISFFTENLFFTNIFSKVFCKTFFKCFFENFSQKFLQNFSQKFFAKLFSNCFVKIYSNVFGNKIKQIKNKHMKNMHSFLDSIRAKIYLILAICTLEQN